MHDPDPFTISRTLAVRIAYRRARSRLRSRRQLLRMRTAPLFHPHARRVYLRHLVRPLTVRAFRERLMYLPDDDLHAMTWSNLIPKGPDESLRPTEVVYLCFEEWMVRSGTFDAHFYLDLSLRQFAAGDMHLYALHAALAQWVLDRPADAMRTTL